MAARGITRNLDQLGRIVIPIETRRALGIEPGIPVEIRQENDKIILSVAGEQCVVCGGDKALKEFKDRKICNRCLKELQKTFFADAE